MNMDISQDIYKVVPEHLYPSEKIQDTISIRNMKIVVIVAVVVTVFSIGYTIILTKQDET
jgi:hypothetical protein